MRYRLPLLINRDMKKIIILAVLALLSQSCHKYSTEKPFENPQISSVKYLHSNALSHVLKAVNLTDFFDRYQELRQDRDAAIALAKEYFGDRFQEDNLTYEKFHSWMGSIFSTTTPGLYKIVYYDHSEDGEQTLYAEVMEDNRIRITSKVPRTKDVGPTWIPYEIDVECTAAVTPENIAVIENLDLKYEEKAEGNVTTARITSTPEPVEIRLRTVYDRAFLPIAGILDFTIGGTFINDEFSVKYSEDKYSLL